MRLLPVYLSLLALASVACVQAMQFQQQPKEVLVQKLFGAGYTVSISPSFGGPGQYGTFSGGNAVNFGIDSGVVLSSGSLGGGGTSYATDPRVLSSQDAASLKATVQAAYPAPASLGALTTFTAVLCTCENPGTSTFFDTARVYVNDAVTYEQKVSPGLNRGMGNFFSEIGLSSCKCSTPATFSMAYSDTPATFELFISDVWDTAGDSFIFLGAQPPSFVTVPQSTSIIGTTVTLMQTTTEYKTPAAITSTVFTSTTTPSVTSLATDTTVTSFAPTPTVTVTNCMDASLTFNAGCCPTQLLQTQQLRKRNVPITPGAAPFAIRAPSQTPAPLLKRHNKRQVPITVTITSGTTTITTIAGSTTVTQTVTSDAATPTAYEYLVSTAPTQTFYSTSTVTSTPAQATATACSKKVAGRPFACPSTPANLSAQQKSYLNQYRFNQPGLTAPNLPNVFVKCIGRAQQYVYKALSP